MTIFHSSLTHLVLDFPRLSRQLSPQGVASTIVSALYRFAGKARVSLSLRVETGGAGTVQSAAGLMLPGEPVFGFSQVLSVRNADYGHLQVDVLEPVDDSGLTFALLDTLALQIGLYAERLRLRHAQENLRQQHEELRETLATEKAVVRAAGILARERSISLAKAEQWIRSEALRRDRTALSLAEMVIATLLPRMANFSSTQPGQPRGVAA